VKVKENNMDAVKNLVYGLLTENTGSALGDSGDAYGRHWQRNAKKSIQDFDNEPQAVLEISQWNDGTYEAIPTISLYHHLTNILSLDDLCNEFNAQPVNDWDSDEYYGVSSAGEKWLEDNGFETLGDTFNSYNGDSCLSQVIQGETFKRDFEYYALIQVHGGCDVRGGYTDAKLFKLDEEYQLYAENCSFSLGDADEDYLDYHNGEWTNYEGNYLSREELSEIISKVAKSGKTEIKGYLSSY
jgi:hypothetical protein